MRSLFVGAILVGGTLLLAPPLPAAPPAHVDTLQSAADTAWEGIDGDSQQAILSTGLVGDTLDRLVVDYRTAELDAVGLDGEWVTTLERQADGDWGVYLVPAQVIDRCFEDEPCWNCETMGNRICGTLPRTS